MLLSTDEGGAIPALRSCSHVCNFMSLVQYYLKNRKGQKKMYSDVSWLDGEKNEIVYQCKTCTC